MGEKVMPVVVWDERPQRFEPLEVETTPTPGLYVAQHPGNEEGWVLVAECGKYVANVFRWTTIKNAQIAAMFLGHVGIGWTLPESELIAATPHAAGLINSVLEPLEELRYPFQGREPGPNTKHGPAEARKAATAELIEGPIGQ